MTKKGKSLKIEGNWWEKKKYWKLQGKHRKKIHISVEMNKKNEKENCEGVFIDQGLLVVCSLYAVVKLHFKAYNFMMALKVKQMSVANLKNCF